MLYRHFMITSLWYLVLLSIRLITRTSVPHLSHLNDHSSDHSCSCHSSLLRSFCRCVCIICISTYLSHNCYGEDAFFLIFFLPRGGGEEIPSNKRKQCWRFIASNIYSVPFLFSYVRDCFRKPFSSGSDSIFLTMLSYRNNGTVMHNKYSTYFWCRPGFLNFSVLWIRNDLFRIRFRIQLFAIFYFILQFYSTQSPEFKDK